jgi:hypothetical protein
MSATIATNHANKARPVETLMIVNTCINLRLRRRSLSGFRFFDLILE